MGEASTTLLRTLPEYDEGLAAYRARRWMTAIDHFQKLLDIAADRPARAMIAHCRHFIKKDVGSYWNTSWDDFEQRTSWRCLHIRVQGSDCSLCSSTSLYTC